MNGITTHVLDTARGVPAAGIPVRLERLDGDAWRLLGSSVTDADGRCRDLVVDGIVQGRHRIVFATGPYFASIGVPVFFPEVVVTFEVAVASEHYHVPLLLAPHSFTTYRGS